jgi:hypothetical protein
MGAKAPNPAPSDPKPYRGCLSPAPPPAKVPGVQERAVFAYYPLGAPGKKIAVEIGEDGSFPVALDLDLNFKDFRIVHVGLSRKSARKLAEAILAGLEAGSCPPVEIRGD